MGGRAVEGTGLENRQARKGLVSSNLTPSATLCLRLRVSLRGVLYALARGMGDARAVSRGPRAIEKRVERRVLGRLFSRLIRAIVR